MRGVATTAAPIRPGARLALAVHKYDDDVLAHWLAVRASQQSPADHQVLVDRCDRVEQPPEGSAGEPTRHPASAGIQPGDDLQVDLVAHGTGGLVARWLIEVDGGARYIDRCILAGTPNGGAALAGQGRLAFQRMVLALNLPHGWRPTLLLRWAQGRPVEESDRAQELAPGSPFLRRLMAQASTPAIPHLVLAGDGSGNNRFEPLLCDLAAASGRCDARRRNKFAGQHPGDRRAAQRRNHAGREGRCILF